MYGVSTKSCSCFKKYTMTKLKYYNLQNVNRKLLKHFNLRNNLENSASPPPHLFSSQCTYILKTKIEVCIHCAHLRFSSNHFVLRTGLAISQSNVQTILPNICKYTSSSFSILSDDRFKASSKTIPPHSAI
jgi:hypothetical protein